MQQFISIILSSASGIFSRVFSLSLARDPKIIAVSIFHHGETIAVYNTILCIVFVSWNNNQVFFKNQMSNFCSLFFKKVVIQKFKKRKAFRIIYQCHEDTVCYLQFECERMMMMMESITKMRHFVCAWVLSNVFIYNLFMHIPTHDPRRTIQLWFIFNQIILFFFLFLFFTRIEAQLDT